MNYYSYELDRLRYEEVSPLDFYRDIFPEGSLAEQKDNKEEYEVGKYSGIAICVTNKIKNNGKRLIKRYTITDDLDNIDLLTYSDDFCFMSPIVYAGKSRESKNARYMHALCVEIDNLRVIKKRCAADKKNNYNVRYNKEQGIYEEYTYVGLKYLLDNFESKFPRPTYVVASGTGIHLYYVFKDPIALFPNIAKEVSKFKTALTKRLWDKKITFSWKNEDIQYESIYQGFRMPGTLTKSGLSTKNRRDDVAAAFRVGEKITSEYLNLFVSQKDKMETVYKSKLTLKKAKELYPDWYDRRIVKKEEKGRWVCNEGLYNWWLERIKEETTLGHRYYCMMMLSIYAIKCDIPKDRLEKDCLKLLEKFDDMTEDENNHFTEKDMLDALQVYENKDYVTYPINSIQNRSGLHIEKNKRNGRKQAAHVEYMNSIRKFKVQENECSAGGRPSKEKIVKKWQELNPRGTKYQCIKDTKLSKHTVYRWWDDNIKNNTEKYNDDDIIQF